MSRAVIEAKRAARCARLEYVDPSEPGIRRVRRGRGFAYLDRRGRPVTSTRTLDRIRRLAIPPAWTDVWICASPDGHIQATGRDARGRKQYRYHERWRTHRDTSKFEELVAFAGTLPTLRRRIERDLARPGLPKEKVVAAVVRLIDRTAARVGNDAYARENNSFGLTTLLDRHAVIRGSETRLRFRGKAGRVHELSFEDARLAKIVRRCQDLPGQQLFQYLDDAGEVRRITSSDVNDYIREATNEAATAKTLRTWAATVAFARVCSETEPASSTRATRRRLLRALEEVAGGLGNTVAVCRRSYVHPQLIEVFEAGRFHTMWMRACKTRANGLRRDEAVTLALLRSFAKMARGVAA